MNGDGEAFNFPENLLILLDRYTVDAFLLYGKLKPNNGRRKQQNRTGK